MNEHVDIYRNRVVMSKDLYDALLHRAGLRKRVAELLRDQVEEYDALLRTALHDLAIEQQQDPLLFTRRWMREHRELPPIPFDEKKNGGLP